MSYENLSPEMAHVKATAADFMEAMEAYYKAIQEFENLMRRVSPGSGSGRRSQSSNPIAVLYYQREEDSGNIRRCDRFNDLGEHDCYDDEWTLLRDGAFLYEGDLISAIESTTVQLYLYQDFQFYIFIFEGTFELTADFIASGVNVNKFMTLGEGSFCEIFDVHLPWLAEVILGAVVEPIDWYFTARDLICRNDPTALIGLFPLLPVAFWDPFVSLIKRFAPSSLHTKIDNLISFLKRNRGKPQDELQEAGQEIWEEGVEEVSEEVLEEAIENSSRNALIEELREQGANFTEEEIVGITRTPDGRIVWLEEGQHISEHRGSGLNHIMVQRNNAFASWGLDTPQKVGDFLIETVGNHQAIGTYGERLVFSVDIQGQQKYVAILIGSNGYIVTAHPIGFKDITLFQ